MATRYRDSPTTAAPTPATPTQTRGIGVVSGVPGHHPNASVTTVSAYSPTPSLFRARASDSGSIFHEGVWPPPGEESRFVDPFLQQTKVGGDLGSIVDDIMGPSPTHSRDVSGTSETGLIGAAASPGRSHVSMGSLNSSSSLYNDPFRSTSIPSPSTSNTSPVTSPSVYYYRPDSQLSLSLSNPDPPPLPAGAAAPKKPSPLVQSVVRAPSSTSLGAPPPPSSFLQSAATSPKNWIERSPKKGLRPLSPPSASGGANSGANSSLIG